MENLIDKWRQMRRIPSRYREELSRLTEAEAEDAFGRHIDFGTGGLRGLMGVGPNRINEITIMQTTLGFADYLIDTFTRPLAVAIAYDTRANSKTFARIAARALAYMDIDVLLFQHPRPTPELSFAVRRFHAQGGIVITASHNPPRYNGYKIYDEEGCQLVPEKAAGVAAKIQNRRAFLELTLPSFSALVASGLIKTIPAAFDRRYLSFLQSLNPRGNEKSGLRIVYTPLHGTGAALGKKLLQACGHTVFTVPEQMKPDGSFKTVGYPNPEDAKVFALAAALGKEKHAPLLLATDPDADRLGVGILENGAYHYYSGAEIGVLMLDDLLRRKRYSKRDVVISTIVTPDLGLRMAADRGLGTYATLTGFKFIGDQIARLPKDQRFFFGYEESCGYLLSPEVRDKDAFQAMVAVATLARRLLSKGITFAERLESIYRKHGYYHYELVTIDLTSNAKISDTDIVMKKLRLDPFAILAPVEIVAFEDYLASKRITIAGGEHRLTLPTSDVVKFFPSDGGSLTVRPSGTEPKLKIYITAVGANAAEAMARYQSMRQAFDALVAAL